MSGMDVAGPRVISPGSGAKLPLVGTLTASAADTGGAFEAIEYVGPATPPPHVHREHDEAFYILDGPFRFLLGNEWFESRHRLHGAGAPGHAPWIRDATGLQSTAAHFPGRA
jgi:hypothetical protein